MNENLPKISVADIAGKKVLVRADLEYTDRLSPRGKATDGIVKFLKERNAGAIKLIGHKGMAEMTSWWEGVEVNFDIRADEREKENSPVMAAELAAGWDVFVNESFAESHRVFTSVNALPLVMKKQGRPVYIGIRFEKELEMLNGVLNRPGRKVLVIGGAKAGDKAVMADKLAPKFDAVLRGGLLPGVSLRFDGLDIDDASIEKYKQEIAGASEIVVAGPLGKFEDDNAIKGTKEVYEAVVNSPAFKIAGGGDTEKALEKLGITEKFDWISVGGGAMLAYLADGTLPGIEALIL